MSKLIGLRDIPRRTVTKPLHACIVVIGHVVPECCSLMLPVPSALTPHAVSGDTGFLVWKISQENKKGAPPESELLWIDGSGNVVKRRKGAFPVSIINGTFYEVRIEKRKVKNADCSTADFSDPDAKPNLVDGEEPELSLVKTGPDGKESRRIIVPAEGDEYGERSTEFEVLGMVGGRPSRSRKIVLRNNGIQTRHYAIDPATGRHTHTNGYRGMALTSSIVTFMTKALKR